MVCREIAEVAGRGDTEAMNGNGLGTFLIVLVSVLAAILLLGLCLIGGVMWRYRLPMRGLVAMVGALIYLVSPIDVLPESLLGPFGLVDDAGVVGATVLFVYKLIKVRQKLAEGGVDVRFPARPVRGRPVRPGEASPSNPSNPSSRPFPLDRDR